MQAVQARYEFRCLPVLRWSGVRELREVPGL
jgi:hypothetical protein